MFPGYDVMKVALNLSDLPPPTETQDPGTIMSKVSDKF